MARIQNSTWQVRGLGNAQAWARLQRRPRAFTGMQVTDRYVPAGAAFNVALSGVDAGKVKAVVGVYELDECEEFALVNGANSLVAARGGLLSFVNENDQGSVEITIGTQLPQVPLFRLGSTTNEQWFNAMQALPEAPLAVLVSERNSIVVRYASAHSHVRDPQGLMAQYDQVAKVHDKLAGLVAGGKADYAADPNILMFVESDREGMYMFAMDGFTGYKGVDALNRLLEVESGKWGPWHEIGHQRQQSPWTWSAGTGMTEVTCNLYSMAGFEELYNLDNLASTYPAIHAYLASEVRNYDQQRDHFLKLGMFWQLRQAFGVGFYPQLHQRYRRMEQVPVGNDAMKQRLILETSRLVNLDLTPYFDRWGIPADHSTRDALRRLPRLEAPIWENDDQHRVTLPMPYPLYWPEQAYLLDSLKSGLLTPTGATFLLEADWFANYQYHISVNGKLVAWVFNTLATHCSARLTDQGWEVQLDRALAPEDQVELTARVAGEHRLFRHSLLEQELFERLEAVFVDRARLDLQPWVTQAVLDQLAEEIAVASNREPLLVTFDIAQQLLLNPLIVHVAPTAQRWAVAFRDDHFHLYDIALLTNGVQQSALAQGTPVGSHLEGPLTWVTERVGPASVDLELFVDTASGRYRLLGWSAAEVAVETQIQTLFTDPARTTLRPDATQADIGRVRSGLGMAGLPPGRSDYYYDFMDHVQGLFFRQRTVARARVDGDRVVVEFANELFRQYDYHYLKNGAGAATLIKGTPSGSTLDGQAWTISPGLNAGDQSRVEVSYLAMRYVVFEATSQLIGHSQEWMTLQEQRAVARPPRDPSVGLRGGH